MEKKRAWQYNFFIHLTNPGRLPRTVRRTLILEGSANEEKSCTRGEGAGARSVGALRVTGQVEMTWNDEACGV